MQDISKIWPEWKVMELVGEGSFGKVYKCVREEYGITYESAVKVITIPAGSAEYENVRSECNSDAEVKSYFEGIVSDFSNEIKLMLMLKGAANIVSVDNYKIIENKDGFGWKIYIFMEYLTSFTEYSKNKIFTETEVKDFALDMLNALNICAKNNIIHRDIKPANIFVDKFGSFKLGDFGVARRLEGSMSMMSKKGTYSYMAPEVFRGEKYDNRADIYSLGMVMYKLLNRNRDPFIDPNKTVVSYNDRNEAIERRRNGEKPPAPVDASPEMAAIILKAIEFRPSDRFATVEELRTAISALDPVPLSEEPTVADTNGADKTVAAGIGLYSSQKGKTAADDATVKADTEEATLVADATLKAATTPDPEATMKADAAHNKPANDSEKATNPVEKEPKSKKPVAIIAAAILVVLAVVAVVAIMSNGGLKKETGNSTDLQTQLSHTLDVITEVFGEHNRTEEMTDGTTNSVTGTSAQATETVTEKATEAVTEGKAEVLTSGVAEVPATVAPVVPTKPKTEATTNKKTEATTSKKAEATTKKKPVATVPATKAPASKYDSVSVGDYITFGSYEQDNNTSNGKEAIRWCVLDKKDGKVLVISEYALDCQPYTTTYKNVTWETCTLRGWLNDGFINSAFTSSEKAKIPTVTVTAKKNPNYDTEPGNDTYDKVFLLSIDEANKYFDTYSARECKATDYAVARGAYKNSPGGYEGSCWWWLRSPGFHQDYAAGVLIYGHELKFGDVTVDISGPVRPALWINL